LIRARSFSDLQVRCNLRQADSARFISEWVEDLPALTTTTPEQLGRSIPQKIQKANG
jgi:hypothetical protein